MDMLQSLFCIFIAFAMCANGQSLCKNNTVQSCTTQILGPQEPSDRPLCRIEAFPPDSPICGSMSFGPLVANTQIGGIILRPHIISEQMNNNSRPFMVNRTVLNITFSNIKWKTMKFRFQDKFKDTRNHCRNIVISKDVIVNDRSVLYYDCYWPFADNNDGGSHILDFEAANDWITYRGQYYFNIPTTSMLSDKVTESEWKPFIYIEIFLTKMRLHVVPPPMHLKITGYNIKVVKKCGEDASCEVKSNVVPLMNKTDDVSYDYNYVGDNGLFNFVVTPLHNGCTENGLGCKSVESPKITISNEQQSLNICIASISALIVATLFAYYVVLRYLRKYWCKDYKLTMGNEIPTPPKVLVIYSPSNRLHAECVASFISYLRAEYGFDLMYDGDISATSHGDPYIWAEEAFRISTHVLYIVGPAEELNVFNNIYEKPIITPHKNVDTLLLTFIKASRVSKCPKDILNVFFEHSTAPLPLETRHDRSFFLLKDWQKLISHLSKNMLPKRQIMRTEKGRCFLEDLTRAKEILNANRDEVIVNCEKNLFDRKLVL